jgi:hypothetical protein
MWWALGSQAVAVAAAARTACLLNSLPLLTLLLPLLPLLLPAVIVVA